MQTVLLLLLLAAGALPAAQAPEPLAGTAPLEWQDELDVRIMDGAHAFVERQISASRSRRSRYWQRDLSSRAAYEASVEPNRREFRRIIGVVEPRAAPAMERFGDDDKPALVADGGSWRAFQVRWPVLEGVTGEGLLVEPARPPAAFGVLIPDADQTPEDLLAPAARLADRGFIVFAPHNLYRGEDRYRWLDRKANSVKASMFSFLIAQHQQILRWLKDLPFVDGSRIGFYGLSYGGETAVRVPPLLEDYALSICSGDFNNWTRKVASTEEPFSFMFTIEWEMPYFDMGNTFDYAELASLMLPRPFMVERGRHDRVGRDQWVAYEYARLAWLYAQLGLEDRIEIEYFNGGHTINGEGTFRFLHRHLDWPETR